MAESDLSNAEMEAEGSREEESQSSGQLKVFRALDPVTQVIGYALAWIHEEITMTRRTNRLAQAGIRTEAGKRIPNSRVKEALQTLSRQGLANLESGSCYQIERIVSHYLIAELYEHPELLAKLRAFPLHDYPGYGRFNQAYFRYQRGKMGFLRAERDLRDKGGE